MSDDDGAFDDPEVEAAVARFWAEGGDWPGHEEVGSFYFLMARVLASVRRVGGGDG